MTVDGELEDGDVLRVRANSANQESIFVVVTYTCPEYGDLGFDEEDTPSPYYGWHLRYRDWAGCQYKERLI